MDELVNSLIEAIDNFNSEEAVYWSHLIKQKGTATAHSQNIFSFPLITSIFKGFQLGNQELSSILSQLIWESLKEEDFPIIIQNYKNELMEGLKQVADEDVSKLCLRIIFDLGIGKGHQIDDEVLKVSLKLMNDGKYSVSSFLTEQLIKHSKDLSERARSLLLEMYSASDSNDSVVKFRYLELFQKTKSEIFYMEIKTILSKPEDDLLLTANVLQIIQDCIVRREQFEIFNNEGIIELIIKTLYLHQNIVSKSLDVLANCALNHCFDSEFIQSTGLNRIVYQIEPVTSSSVFCSCAIAALSPDDSGIISDLLKEFLFHGTSPIQLAALHGLGIYFKSTEISSETKVSLLSNLNILNSWFIERLSSTFDEQKSASYFALKSIISSSKESFKFLLNLSNIFGNLLERSLDQSLLGLQWKYGIIEDVRISSDLFDCLNDPLKEKVVNYLRLGILFIPKTTQVAYEGQ